MGAAISSSHTHTHTTCGGCKHTWTALLGPQRVERQVQTSSASLPPANADEQSWRRYCHALRHQMVCYALHARQEWTTQKFKRKEGAFNVPPDTALHLRLCNMQHGRNWHHFRHYLKWHWRAPRPRRPHACGPTHGALQRARTTRRAAGA